MVGVLCKTSSRWPPPPSLTVLPQAKASSALPIGSKMTAEKFLKKLPKFVIRQGEVIDIQGPIRDTLQVRPALAIPAFLGGFTINPGPAYQCSGSGLGAPEESLDREMSPSELFHCFPETGAGEGSGLGPREQLGWQGCGWKKGKVRV